MTKTAAADPFGAEVEVYQKRNASPLVAALEAAWAQIRAEVPDVPPVMFSVGGSHDRSAHFAMGKWSADGSEMAEVFVNRAVLARGATEVMATLLHVAAHGLAHTRGVKDTSRYGRYHNGSYASLAAELGLDAAVRGTHGFAHTTMTPGAKEDYAPEIVAIAKALEGIEGAQDVKHVTGRASNNNGVVATCMCDTPRRIRVAQSVLDLGIIECHNCGSAFEAR